MYKQLSLISVTFFLYLLLTTSDKNLNFFSFFYSYADTDLIKCNWKKL